MQCVGSTVIARLAEGEAKLLAKSGLFPTSQIRYEEAISRSPTSRLMAATGLNPVAEVRTRITHDSIPIRVTYSDILTTKFSKEFDHKKECDYREPKAASLYLSWLLSLQCLPYPGLYSLSKPSRPQGDRMS